MDEVRTSHQRVLPCNSVELQKLLIDEQMRCETHRSNYQTLKEEHTRLGEEHLKLHQEISDLHQDKQTTIIENKQKDEIIEALNQRIQLKAQELELMKTQVIDPAKLEALKAEISKKLEEPLKEQMIAMDKEVESYRTQYNKMRYEYTILKTELDHKDNRHKRLLEEQSLKFQAEISALKYERDELSKEEGRRRCPADEDAFVQLRKAKAHLEQRIRVLEEEIEEERKSRDHRDRENEAIQKTYAQDLARTEAQLKAMQVEKSSIESQVDRLKRESADKSERFTQLSNQLRQSEKQISHLRSELEEEEHQRRLAEGAHKVEVARQRGEMQRLQDSLSAQIKELETKLEIARGEAEQHAVEVAEVEARASCRVQDELKDEWTRYNALHADMTATADRLRCAEQKLSEERAAKRRVEEEMRSKSAEAEAATRGLRAELNSIKAQLSDEMTSQREERERVEELRVIRERLMRREAEIREMSEAIKKMADEKDQMMTDAKKRREEAEELCLKLKREKAETKRLLEEHDGTRMMEKQRMQSRIDQIECKLSKREDEMTSLKKQHKKVKSVCLHKLKSLSNELQLSNAENQKLQIELRAGKLVSLLRHQ